MEVDRPQAGEELNLDSPPTRPRQAATVIVLRGDDERLEVLLVQRNPAQKFMGGAWVFPGGAVDADEAESAPGDLAHRRAGVREVAEEVAITLPDPEALVAFSRWITPPIVAKRFDTRFYLARIPDGAEPQIDRDECVDMGWYSPAAALEAYEAGELMLVFPTFKTLEQLSGFGSARELLDWADGREVVPIEPRVIVEGEAARIVLPGEPGYEA